MPELQDIARNSSFNWFQFGNGGIYYGLLLYCGRTDGNISGNIFEEWKISIK